MQQLQKGTKYFYIRNGVLTKKQQDILTHCKNNNIRKIEAMNLIIYSDDVEVQDKLGNTPLHYAAKSGSLTLCNFLCLKGARPKIVNNEGDTALHMAFYSGKMEVSES